MAASKELDVITQHNTLVLGVIAVDLNYFSNKFVEKAFVARDVCTDISGMHGVGARDKAGYLLGKVLGNLKTTRDTRKWFHDFVAIFSVEAAYRNVADTLMEDYQPSGQSQSLSGPAGGESPAAHVLDTDDLADIHAELLNVAHRWKGVGLALRLHPDLLDRIEADDRSGSVEDCLRKVLAEWLKQSYNTDRFGLPSWKQLVKAVALPTGGNNRALAEQMAKNHDGN